MAGQLVIGEWVELRPTSRGFKPAAFFERLGQSGARPGSMQQTGGLLGIGETKPAQSAIPHECDGQRYHGHRGDYR